MNPGEWRQLFAIGQRVRYLGIEAFVTGILLRGGEYAQYEIAWTREGVANDKWVLAELVEMIDPEQPQQRIGFVPIAADKT